jgi:hypothetical protein
LTPFFARTSLITAWLDLRHSLTLDIARKLLRPTKPSEVEVEKKKERENWVLLQDQGDGCAQARAIVVLPVTRAPFFGNETCWKTKLSG